MKFPFTKGFLSGALALGLYHVVDQKRDEQAYVMGLNNIGSQVAKCSADVKEYMTKTDWVPGFVSNGNLENTVLQDFKKLREAVVSEKAKYDKRERL